MTRINKILKNPSFINYIKANAVREAERIFCKHDMSHIMDVARIAYILNLEEEYGLSKDVIYGAALLHDIGRHVQYDTGEKHAAVSARLAGQILRDCGYSAEEGALIISAIATHSDKSLVHEKTLNGLLARADMLSRACWCCKASTACNWDSTQKNEGITW